MYLVNFACLDYGAGVDFLHFLHGTACEGRRDEEVAGQEHHERDEQPFDTHEDY